MQVARITEELEYHRPRRDHEHAWLDDAHMYGDYDPAPAPVRLVDPAVTPDLTHPRTAAFVSE
ncbi:hypothetical protein ACFRCG_38015 [Embleya sp. NPDC056575]|uniref:hypothetical protein n=1 Tax=unclassified Embleya TaxID=2699296 RepID=UPI00367D4F52